MVRTRNQKGHGSKDHPQISSWGATDLKKIGALIEQHTSPLKSTIRSLCDIYSEVQSELSAMKVQNNNLQSDLENWKLEQAMSEVKKNYNNIIIHGIAKNKAEHPNQVLYLAQDILSSMLKMKIVFSSAFRLGQGISAPIKATLQSAADKAKIYKSAHNLAGSNIFICDDLPLYIREKRRLLAAKVKEFKRNGKKVRFSGINLLVDEVVCTPESVKMEVEQSRSISFVDDTNSPVTAIISSSKKRRSRASGNNSTNNDSISSKDIDIDSESVISSVSTYDKSNEDHLDFMESNMYDIEEDIISDVHDSDDMYDSSDTIDSDSYMMFDSMIPKDLSEGNIKELLLEIKKSLSYVPPKHLHMEFQDRLQEIKQRWPECYMRISQLIPPSYIEQILESTTAPLTPLLLPSSSPLPSSPLPSSSSSIHPPDTEEKFSFKFSVPLVDNKIVFTPDCISKAVFVFPTE
jgi:hypothetical protein